MAPATALVRLEKVSRVFDDGVVVALADIDLSIFAGECTTVVGRSGSGKTSLINMICGFDAPSAGRVYWAGRPVADARCWTSLRSKEIGIVFQDFLLFPTLTALENVEMPLLGGGVSARERRERASTLLDLVGLGARMHHLPHALSGGERQRVAIARGIVNRPSLLLADEPTGCLDSGNSGIVIDLLLQIQRSHGMALVIVTHDEALAGRGQRRIVLRDWRIVEDNGGALDPSSNGKTP